MDEIPGPYKGSQSLFHVQGDDVQPASVFPHGDPARVRLQRLVQDEQRWLVIAVEELDVDDVVHDVGLDHRGQVEGVRGQGGSSRAERKSVQGEIFRGPGQGVCAEFDLPPNYLSGSSAGALASLRKGKITIFRPYASIAAHLGTSRMKF